MPMSRARALCPAGIYVRPRFELYRSVSDEIHRIMLHYAAEIEPISLDEAFMDITGMGTQYPTLGAIGRAIKERSGKRRASWRPPASRRISSSPKWPATWTSPTA